VLKSGVQRDETELVRELCELVRERIGPVAFFKQAAIVGKLPKTRSGKILRGTIRKIADGIDYAMPPTIEDPAALDEMTRLLSRLGYARKALACLPPRTYPLTERRVALADGASAVPSGWRAIRSDFAYFCEVHAAQGLRARLRLLCASRAFWVWPSTGSGAGSTPNVVGR